jgi:hypothetical protein
MFKAKAMPVQGQAQAKATYASSYDAQPRPNWFIHLCKALWNPIDLVESNKKLKFLYSELLLFLLNATRGVDTVILDNLHSVNSMAV